MIKIFVTMILSFLGCKPPQPTQTVSQQTSHLSQTDPTSQKKEESTTKTDSSSKTSGSEDPFSSLMQKASESSSKQSLEEKSLSSEKDSQNQESDEPTYVTVASRFSGRNHRTPKLNNFEGPLPKYKNGSDDVFHCPSDSLLVGIEATYNLTSLDREYRAHCQFFETMTGKDLKKKECHTDSKPYNKTDEFSSSFSCPEGQHLSGLKSVYNSQTKDRSVYFECCTLSPEQETKPIVKWTGETQSPENISCTQRITQDKAYLNQENYERYGSLINDDVNAYQQPFIFICPENTVLSTIRSSLMEGKSDRRYSFRCCPLMKEGKL